MTPEIEALARRAVACPDWRWMPGMLLTSGDRICSPRGKFDWVALHGGSKVYVAGGIPDFDDPATLGCLLQLVNEAWPGVVIRYELGYARYNGLEHYTNEEAPHTFIVLRSPESLVAALEAAR